MAKQAKNEEGEQSSEVSKNLLGSLMNGYKDTIYNHINPVRKKISTGSLVLDSYINITSGGTVRVGGAQAESGKSSECILLAQNYMQTMPKSKGLLINAEARLSEEFKTRTGAKFVEKPEDWVYGTIFVMHTNVMESFCPILQSLLSSMFEQGENLVAIVDSIDMCTLKNSGDKVFGDSTKIAGVPFLTKELFRRIGHLIDRYNALLLITSQYSSTISLDPHGPKEPPKLVQGSAANALNHMCNNAIYYRPRYQGDLILEDDNEKPDRLKNKILGVYATVEIKKSSNDTTGTVVRIPIKKGRIGNSIWVEKEVADLILDNSLATRKGAWINFGEVTINAAKEEGVELKVSIQGKPQLYDYLENDKNVFNFFFKRFKNIDKLGNQSNVT